MELLIPFLKMLIPLFAIFSIFFIPITGVMLILVSKFAFRPLVETIAMALRESGQGNYPGRPGEIQMLHEEMRWLTDEIRQLKEAQEFDRRLVNPSTIPIRSEY